MLRGVNKSIIEILETENQYFEKVILFVRPSHLEKDKTFLDTKAKEYVSDVNYVLPKEEAKKKVGMSLAMKLGSAAAAGATIATFLLRM